MIDLTTLVWCLASVGTGIAVGAFLIGFFLGWMLRKSRTQKLELRNQNFSERQY